MNSLMLASLSGDDALLISAGIAAVMVLMCLKTLGHGYYTAVCWHNLRVEAQRLRIKHDGELEEFERLNRPRNARQHDTGSEAIRPDPAPERAPD